MGSDSDDRFVDKVVARDLTEDAPDFSDSDIEFARHNPSVLQKLADPLEVKKRYIYVLFSVAVGMAVVSKIIEYTGVLESHKIANDIFGNVMFSVSIELFGASAVAFLMELVFERRVQRNQDLVKALIHEVDQRNDDQPRAAPPASQPQ